MRHLVWPLALAGALCTTTPAAVGQQRAPTCDDLNWSAQVIAANPTIRQSCIGVYVRNDTYYARSRIELVRINGNFLSFRPLLVDGGKGETRRVRVPAGWVARIDGRDYTPGDLSPGQQLDVYIPEDRFALAIHDGSFDGDEEMMAIEQAEVTKLPEKPEDR
jgi:hypothetical protein